MKAVKIADRTERLNEVVTLDEGLGTLRCRYTSTTEQILFQLDLKKDISGSGGYRKVGQIQNPKLFPIACTQGGLMLICKTDYGTTNVEYCCFNVHQDGAVSYTPHPKKTMFAGIYSFKYDLGFQPSGDHTVAIMENDLWMDYSFCIGNNDKDWGFPLYIPIARIPMDYAFYSKNFAREVRLIFEEWDNRVVSWILDDTHKNQYAGEDDTYQLDGSDVQWNTRGYVIGGAPIQFYVDDILWHYRNYKYPMTMSTEFPFVHDVSGSNKWKTAYVTVALTYAISFEDFTPLNFLFDVVPQHFYTIDVWGICNGKIDSDAGSQQISETKHVHLRKVLIR